MKNQSILIAENDEDLMKILRLMFEEKNFNTFTADNGISALELFRKHSPKIVLMDIDMPEKNGWEVLEEIRTQDQLTPVIIMTGRNIEEKDSVKSYDIGATFFIRKPFHYKEIFALIDSLVKSMYGFADIITFGSFHLNMSSFILEHDKQTFTLTEREAKVLYMLAKNANRKVELSKILNEIWYNDESASNRQMLKNTIAKLRKIIEEDPKIKLESIYGIGYILIIEE